MVLILSLGMGLVTIKAIKSKSEPQIIVAMPPDAKPIEQLDKTTICTNVITQDRAVLWWTVYKYTLSRGYGPSTASEKANSAVDSCYGKR